RDRRFASPCSREESGANLTFGAHPIDDRRATGITAYLKNGGMLEHAQQRANHALPAHDKTIQPALGRNRARRGGEDFDLTGKARLGGELPSNTRPSPQSVRSGQ